jgi:hypothetical protein
LLVQITTFAARTATSFVIVAGIETRFSLTTSTAACHDTAVCCCADFRTFAGHNPDL